MLMIQTYTHIYTHTHTHTHIRTHTHIHIHIGIDDLRRFNQRTVLEALPYSTRTTSSGACLSMFPKMLTFVFFGGGVGGGISSKMMPPKSKHLREIPLVCSTCFGIIFNMESLSNMIPFDFVLKINFDKISSLKRCPPKKK